MSGHRYSAFAGALTKLHFLWHALIILSKSGISNLIKLELWEDTPNLSRTFTALYKMEVQLLLVEVGTQELNSGLGKMQAL